MIRLVVLALLLGACGGSAPSNGDDDYCAPACAQAFCAEPDGTEWQIAADGSARRVVIQTGTEHAVAKILCEVAPSGYVIGRAQ